MKRRQHLGQHSPQLDLNYPFYVDAVKSEVKKRGGNPDEVRLADATIRERIAGGWSVESIADYYVSRSFKL